MLLRSSAPPTLFVVLADPKPDEVAEFHRWYDEVHGPDALGNGSFVALSRFEAVGPGHLAAPYLAFWEGAFEDERSAWSYIRPRAMALRAAGRADDIASVSFALMLLRAMAVAGSGEVDPVGSLVTVQNDWRFPERAQPVDAWLASVGIDTIEPSGNAWVLTSDPAGRGAGYHLAAFASRLPVEASIDAWAGVGTPGMSPVPPFTNIFGVAAEPRGPAPEPSDAWVMHWRPVASQRVAGA